MATNEIFKMTTNEIFKNAQEAMEFFKEHMPFQNIASRAVFEQTRNVPDVPHACIRVGNASYYIFIDSFEQNEDGKGGDGGFDGYTNFEIEVNVSFNPTSNPVEIDGKLYTLEDLVRLGRKAMEKYGGDGETQAPADVREAAITAYLTDSADEELAWVLKALGEYDAINTVKGDTTSWRVERYPNRLYAILNFDSKEAASRAFGGNYKEEK